MDDVGVTWNLSIRAPGISTVMNSRRHSMLNVTGIAAEMNQALPEPRRDNVLQPDAGSARREEQGP